MKIIETNRLILREYMELDIDYLHKILSDPITMSFWPAPFTLDQAEGWVRRNMQSYRDNGFGRWAVILKETGKQIGDCGIMLSEIDGKIENDLGYIFYHEYWHRGFAVEAARACMKYGFESLGLDRLFANMAFDNIASARVAERLGMKKEREFFNRRNRGILTYVYSVGI